MSASNEWTEWHLTPSGWVVGTEKEDFRKIERDPPADRVKTVRWHDYLSSGFSKPHRYHSDVWSSEDKDAIARLEAQFGPAPGRL
jgi:hypothetical protein